MGWGTRALGFWGGGLGLRVCSTETFVSRNQLEELFGVRRPTVFFTVPARQVAFLSAWGTDPLRVWGSWALGLEFALSVLRQAI